MVIEKVHGLHATSLSLNDRFTMLSSMVTGRVAMGPKRRPSMNTYLNPNLNFMNGNLLEQIARRLQQQANRMVQQRALHQRLGNRGGLRRFGSEGNLPGLRRSNSFGNLSQQSIKNRVSWRQSNGNLSRSASFNNLSQRLGRGRGSRRWFDQRGTRGRFRGGRQAVGVAKVQASGNRPQLARRGTGRGRGRGGVPRKQPGNIVPSKEELDTQLEQYMAGSKAALDRELDQYMKEAMDFD